MKFAKEENLMINFLFLIFLDLKKKKNKKKKKKKKKKNKKKDDNSIYNIFTKLNNIWYSW